MYFARLEKKAIGSSSVTDSDTVAGYHACGGAMVHLTSRFFTGFDARFLFAKVKYFQGGQVEVNGLRVTAMAGLQF